MRGKKFIVIIIIVSFILTKKVNSEKNLSPNSMNITLEWYDEPDETRRHENQPDEFLLILQSPQGELYESDWVYNDNSGHGYIEISTSLIDPPVGWDYDLSQNEWTIIIACGNCGDHEANYFGVLRFSDSGNFWQMIVQIDYCYESE